MGSGHPQKEEMVYSGLGGEVVRKHCHSEKISGDGVEGQNGERRVF